MKHHQHTTPLGSRTTPSEVCGWAQALTRLHARSAPRFARPEPRRRALLYLQGLFSSIARKNGWQLAEHAREATPYGMQRLLSNAVWDVDGVRDDVRSCVLAHLGDMSAILVLDETSFSKRGKKSAGVGLQYCGTTGQVENCQVGVFLSYVTSRGHALIDRELYLPSDWLADRERCREAGIPETVRLQTKPELARQMIERLWKAQIPIAWVVADTVYGGNLDLRDWLEQHQYSYVLAVACDEPVGIQTPDGRRRVTVAEAERLLLADQDWQRLSMSNGTKGPRLFDWARVPVLHRWEDDGRHWLLIRRSLSDPQEKRYYFVFAPPATTLSQMVEAIGARWHIEEDFANAKDMGLDHYEVRSWIGWYRHVTLVMLAHAFLTGICAQLVEPSLDDSALPIQASEEREPSAVLPALLPLTVPEVRHLLGHLIWPAVTSVTLVLAWSWWRRWHRSWASYSHRQRRLQAQASARGP
jgi:SRSO17 transposase